MSPSALYSITHESLSTHIWSFLFIFSCQDIPEHINRRIRLNGNASLHALLMNKSQQLPWTCWLGCGISWVGASNRVDSCFIVEAVEITSSFLEIPDPFMWLMNRCVSFRIPRQPQDNIGTIQSHLRNHHMAVKGSLAMGLSWPADMRADLGDNRSSKGDVGDKMAIHDVNMEPV